MIITTTDFIPGREIEEVLDVARGSTVRAKNIGRAKRYYWGRNPGIYQPHGRGPGTGHRPDDR